VTETEKFVHTGGRGEIKGNEVKRMQRGNAIVPAGPRKREGEEKCREDPFGTSL